MMQRHRQSVAVVGAGIAGAAIARALVLAGHTVHVFDKSRGSGGRLASRRVNWVDRDGNAATTQLDHGAIGFTASTAAFQTYVDLALQEGRLAEWRPKRSAASVQPEGDAVLYYVPTPDMPALCRHLLDGVAAHWCFAVDGLHRSTLGWQVQAGAVHHPVQFDTVVLALPPAQAASLLGPHRLDWARLASAVPMQPCWTLLGIAADSEPALGWDMARPATGLLACVLRNESRPGRTRVPGQAHWVAHARTDWSRRHLEQPSAWVQQQMQNALAECLDRPIDWHYCTVHRWRYALPPASGTASSASFWWDAEQGLGACGDFLGGGGVEVAWLSARGLSAALPNAASEVTGASTACGAA